MILFLLIAFSAAGSSLAANTQTRSIVRSQAVSVAIDADALVTQQAPTLAPPQEKSLQDGEYSAQATVEQLVEVTSHGQSSVTDREETAHHAAAPPNVLVLDGRGKDSFDPVCITDPSQTTIPEEIARDGEWVRIAAQCCDSDGKCMRHTGTNDNNPTTGCIVGKATDNPSSIKETTYQQAVARCAERSLILCDKHCADTGCNYNQFPVWTSKPCDSAPTTPAPTTPAPTTSAPNNPPVPAACSPCEFRGKTQEGKGLMLDIFSPAANQANAGKASPVVLAFHGSGGTLKSVHGVCKKLVVPAGLVCVTVDYLGANSLQGAIRYLTEHAGTYGVDPDNFFAYGYSLGGYSALQFMMMESDVGNKLKGVVSDCSAPGNVADFLKKDSSGKYLRIPPYLMIHCDVDPRMVPRWTVDKSERKLKDANEKRGKHEKIQWQSMRFSVATGCKHQSLTIFSDEGAKAMLSFIQSVVAGANPFTNIPKKVTGVGVVSHKPKKKA